MKKRTIFAIVITIMVVFALNKYWIMFNPMPVSLDIKGKGKVNVEVQLNKKNDDKFKKNRGEKTDINLDEKSHIDFLVDRARSPKRVRLIFTVKNLINPIVLNSINFKNGELIINDFSKFMVEGANFEVKDNELILKPTNVLITVTYPDKLKLKSTTEFDCKFFIILVILSFLLAYKFSDYIADFKTTKKKPLTDIIFLTIFFISLFIPMSYINSDSISLLENRTLAKWKPLMLPDNGINYDFGKDFNSWFNDRFAMRQILVDINGTITDAFSQYYEDDFRIYNKKKDFAYFKMPITQKILLHTDTLSEKELKKVEENVKTLAEICKKNNVKLYIFMSCDKESIYPEYYPPKYRPTKNISRYDQIYNLLKTIDGVTVISPKEKLLKEKANELQFQRYDTHLRPIGSFHEYHLLVSTIQKDFKNNNLNILELKDFNKVEVSRNTGDSIKGSIFQTKYKKSEKYTGFTLKNNQINLIKDTKPQKDSWYRIFYNNKSKNNLNCVIIGDSFHYAYMNWLANNFKQTKSLFISMGDDFVLEKNVKKMVFNNKPDILIIETTERFTPRLMNLESFYDIFDKK